MVAVGELLQLLYVPSPQSKRYSTGCPRLQLEPPVENVSVCPTVPDVGPKGVFGMLTVWEFTVDVHPTKISPNVMATKHSNTFLGVSMTHLQLLKYPTDREAENRERNE